MELKLRIDWSELDLFAHVNNVAYFKYLQASRVNYWENTSMMKMFVDNKIGPILVSSSCQFKKPLFYPGNITVKARVEFIKNTSFGISHVILNDTGEVVAEAHDVIVLYDFKNNQKVTFPENLKREIEELEGRSF